MCALPSTPQRCGRARSPINVRSVTPAAGAGWARSAPVATISSPAAGELGGRRVRRCTIGPTSRAITRQLPCSVFGCFELYRPIKKLTGPGPSAVASVIVALPGLADLLQRRLHPGALRQATTSSSIATAAPLATGLQVAGQTCDGWFLGGGTEYAVSLPPGPVLEERSSLLWYIRQRTRDYLRCTAASAASASGTVLRNIDSRKLSTYRPRPPSWSTASTGVARSSRSTDFSRTDQLESPGICRGFFVS